MFSRDMFSRGFRGEGEMREGEMELGFVKMYSASIQTMINFLNNVSLSKSSSKYELESVSRQLKKFTKSSQQCLNIVRPLGKFCLRLLEAYYGFVEIHNMFLQLCYVHNLPREALSIIRYPAIPKLNVDDYNMNRRLCGLLFLKLRLYEESYQQFQQALKWTALKNTDQYDNLKKYVLLGIVIGKPIHPEQFKNQVQNMKTSHIDYQGTVSQELQQKKTLEAFTKFITLNEKITKQELKIVALGHEDIFPLISKQLLRSYIQHQLMPTYHQIKAHQVQGVSLVDYQNARLLNNPTSIYRYNNKTQCCQFNHAFLERSQKDQQVTKCMQMHNEIANNVVQKVSRIGGLSGISFGGFMH